ncbi:MAG: tRNA pseudouridine(38-40) synthase TruA [Gammaproteobacteria bacterium]|nr:tRNA pseudouridine(38-40) synthase TruA [Gammaproteobacteria bacterium]MDH5800943.1 tRNA pseudouridine(38-40) synthase TruA [Gammaproteobacteria bacterium]
MRIALGIEYDGSAYNGWQLQDGDNVTTVQACVEQAVTTVANHPVRVICAGRTDTGVHALSQVVHFETESERSQRSWVFGCNANLPKNIVVTWARMVSEDFHARFSAKSRRYLYVILNRPVRPTFLAKRVTWEYRPLDEQRMADAAQALVGEHDFNAYRATACQAKSPVRHVYSIEVRRNGEWVTIEIRANAFLHHMVRNIAGVLMTIGAGEQAVAWAEQVLQSRDRSLGGVTSPPCGLYLVDVEYDDSYGLPRVSDEQLLWKPV